MAAILLATMLLANMLGGFNATIPSTGFKDVPPSSPYYAAVTDLAIRGFVSGYSDGTFRPDTRIDRHDMERIVCAANEWEASSDTCKYAMGGAGSGSSVQSVEAVHVITHAMVLSGEWLYQKDDPRLYPGLVAAHRIDMITYAYYAGQVSGTTPTTRWNNQYSSATRGWFALTFWQAKFKNTPEPAPDDNQGQEPTPTPQPEQPTPPATALYPDVPTTHPYVIGVTDLSNRGLLTGFADGTFRPEARITRGDVKKTICATQQWSISSTECANAMKLTGSGTYIQAAETVHAIVQAMVTAGKWQYQADNTSVYPNVTKALRIDLITFAHYAGPVPTTSESEMWSGQYASTTRGWLAQTLWLAMYQDADPAPKPPTTEQPSVTPTPNPDPAQSPTPSPEPTTPSQPSQPDNVTPEASGDQSLAPQIKPFAGSGANAVAPGAMHLTATFNSIGIEVQFSGDANQNAVAALAFKRKDSSAWRNGLPLWGTYAAGSPAFYGSALMLDAGTAYDIQVSFSDPDGISGTFVVTGSITTRAENIPAASALQPTHFVSPTGSDANAGTSAGAPWKTLDKVFKSAPDGAVVQLAPGTYAPPTVERKTPITLVAQYAAVDDNNTPINAGKHSVIAPATVAMPNSGTWQQVSLQGPATGKNVTVWKWANAPVGSANLMTYASNANDTPMNVAFWDRKSGSFGKYEMTTPAGWAEVMASNDMYRYGFASFGSDIYVRMPGDLNPNNLIVTIHKISPNQDGKLVFQGPNIRISGLEIRSVPVQYSLSTATNGVIDHNLMLNAGIEYKAEQGPPSRYPTDHVVQYNRLVNTGSWNVDPAYPTIPWTFIKYSIKIDGQTTSWNRVGAMAEVTAIVGRGGAQRLVVRHNTIDGFFNGIGGGNGGFDRYSQQDTDIYDNHLQHISDDSFEPEQQVINWRIWDNRLDQVSTALSVGPVNYGPVYFFRNEIWRLGNEGVGADLTGDTGVGVLGFKYSGSDTVPARVFVLQNTFWTADQYASTGASGGAQYAGGGPNSERFLLRNNIFVMTRYAFSAPKNDDAKGQKWDEDYNYFYTSTAWRGMNYGSQAYATVDAYRAVSGEGQHSNVGVSSFNTMPALTNPNTGDLSLASGSPLIDAGVLIPNISDRAGVDFQGAAPDLGAIEH